MKNNRQKPRKNSGEEVHSRSKYSNPSHRFQDWAQQFGSDKSWLGKVYLALESRLSIRWVAAAFTFSFLMSFVLFIEFDFTYSVSEGEAATADIKAPLSFQMVDEIATESKRKEAEREVPPVFDFDPKAYERVLNRIYPAFRSMKLQLRKAKIPRKGVRREELVKDFVEKKPDFEKLIGARISDRTFEWLVENQFSARIENILTRILARWSGEKIADFRGEALPPGEDAILVRLLNVELKSVFREFTLDVERLLSFNDLESFDFKLIRGFSTLSSRDANRMKALAKALSQPNLVYNKAITTERRAAARKGVLPVQISLKRNQTIISEGAIIQPVHLEILEEIETLRSERRMELVGLSAAILFALILAVFYGFVRKFYPHRFLLDRKDFLTLGIIALASVSLTKIFLFLTNTALVARYGSMIPQEAFLYSAPFAAGTLLVGLLFSSGGVVFLFSLLLSICMGILADMSLGYFVVCFLGGLAGARGVASCKKRNDIYIAGLWSGLVAAICVTFLVFLEGRGEGLILQTLIWVTPAAFVGGVLSSMTAMVAIPVIETWFRYTTDVKLLELASLNHPLMKEMIVRAPGTYHHSLIVGSLCEAAAEEIGANALLSKVMAYYHDIGKMDHAQYFIENQRPGHNPHDHISPHMSKTVLVAHVKDGAELGLKHKLGQPIIDGILQHHGTTLISYFYNKALQEQDEEHDHVEMDDFRYPGPRPQFKEAALVMLADSIEAAARSLDEPTPARLQNIVKNIIQNKFLDGQLEECNLTLKDLSSIEATIKRVILGIYHQRIDYPSQGDPMVPGGQKKTAKLRSKSQPA